MTALGAAVVFFFKGQGKASAQRAFLGFAAGVMVAASVWSLLMPSIERAGALGQVPWLPAAGGFLLGCAFLFVLDFAVPELRFGGEGADAAAYKRVSMLVFAVTLHNIPEGMAVGLACAMAASPSAAGGELAAALALALGIGLQNFPEGTAISLPLRQEGMGRGKAFLYGALSGIVEPIAGVVTVFLVAGVEAAMPWLLSFAAGAMIYVVFEELIPEAAGDGSSKIGTMGAMCGFLLMMVMDVALG